jgi:6-pyruvoyl-tetrahydropterin synthase
MSENTCVQDGSDNLIDVENPPINENIDKKYEQDMDEALNVIKTEFYKNIPENPNLYIHKESDSPLTLSYDNSDNEEENFKELSTQQIEQSLDKYYDDSENRFSSELDVMITFMKGQKNLYIQSYFVSKRKLNFLMIPAILISTILTFFTPLFPSCQYGWSTGVSAGLNGITAAFIALINYLKLETSTQTFYNTARQFDKLETNLEFVASKLMFVEKEKEKSNIVYEKLQEIESKIHEMKEWNSLFLPDEIRGLFPIICHINIFSFIKRMESNKKGLLMRFKDVKNEIRYIYHQLDNKKSLNKERLQGRLQFLIDIKDKIKEELIHYRNAYSYIDELFTIEIKNARNSSFWFYLFKNVSKQESCNSINPVVDKYIHCLLAK